MEKGPGAVEKGAAADQEREAVTVMDQWVQHLAAGLPLFCFCCHCSRQWRRCLYLWRR